MNNSIQPHKSSIGDIQANIMALLCYLAAGILAFVPGIRYIAWLAPLVLFFIEKESRFIKFHAMQAFVLNAISTILSLLVSLVFRSVFTVSVYNPYSAYSAIGFAGIIGMLTSVISIVMLVLAILAMVKAYKYLEYRIPLIGGISVKVMEKVK